MIPTPKETVALLKEYNEGEFHLKHGKTVGSVMRWFAEALGYGEEAEVCRWLFERSDRTRGGDAWLVIG